MRAGLLNRLRRLEQRQEEEQGTTGIVIWLDEDGEPDVPVEAIPNNRRLIYLARKAESVEAWLEAMQRRSIWPPKENP